MEGREMGEEDMGRCCKRGRPERKQMQESEGEKQTESEYGDNGYEELRRGRLCERTREGKRVG